MIETEHAQIEHPEYGRPILAVRSWDFASSTSSSADYTASCLMLSTSKGYRIVLDVSQERVTPGARDALVKSKAEMDGRQVYINLEIESGSAGQDQLLHYLRLLEGYNVQSFKPSRDKFARAQQVASWIEHGLVKFTRAPWNNTLFDELRAFPNSDHDDQVDALSGAFNCLAKLATEGTQGNFVASGPGQIKQLTKEDIETMPEGPLKSILSHTRRINRND